MRYRELKFKHQHLMQKLVGLSTRQPECLLAKKQNGTTESYNI